MEATQYPIKEIAKYVITYSFERQKPVSHLALQKIVFFLQREYLQKFHRPLFPEELEAWTFGPVSRDLYSTYCIFSALPIMRQYTTDIKARDKAIINPLIEQYYTVSPWELVKKTHESGTAWATVWEGGAGRYREIPKELIESLG